METIIIAPMLFSLQIPCVMVHYFPETLENFKKIGELIGVKLQIQENQTCCGLPYFEKGEKQTAKSIAEYNLRIFSETNLLCISKHCQKTYTSYYPQIFNNTISHNDCMKLANQVYGLDIIFEKLDKFDFSKLSGKYFYISSNTSHLENELKFISRFKNIEWFMPNLLNTNDGSGFSMPVFSPIESEKLALQLINEAMANTNNIVVNSDISMQYIKNVAVKYKFEINVLHLIDVIAIAI